MSKDKLNLAGALSQRRQLPPIQRGKGVQVSVDESEQKSDLAKSLSSEIAGEQKSKDAIEQNSKIAEQQDSKEAILQTSEAAKQQISDLADSQISTLAEERNSNNANSQTSDLAKEQSGKPAKSLDSKESGVKRINRGVTLPEGLFQEYKLGGVLLKMNMHKLMEEALTAYLPELHSRIEGRK